MVKLPHHGNIKVHGNNNNITENRHILHTNNVAHLKEWANYHMKEFDNNGISNSASPLNNNATTSNYYMKRGINFRVKYKNETGIHQLEKAHKQRKDGTYKIYYDGNNIQEWIKFLLQPYSNLIV